MAKAKPKSTSIKGKPGKKAARYTGALRTMHLLQQYGSPPTWKLNDVDDEEYVREYGKAMNWCNAGLDERSARKELILWLQQNTDADKADRKAINLLPDYKLMIEGHIAYLANNGWPLKVTSFEFLNKGVEKCLEEAKALLAAKKARQKAKAAKPAGSVADTNLIDSWNLKSEVEDRIFPGLSDLEYTEEIMVTMIKGCKAVVTDATAELLQGMLDEVNLIGEDEQVTEGYEHLKKPQIKKIKSDLDASITLLKNNRLNAKAVNLGRKKKPQSALKQTLKMKYKEADDAYNVVSAKPVELIGAKKVVIFNTKSRKVGVYHAKSEDIGFTVKGTTLLGFDENLSQQKTLRKTKDVTVIDHLTSFRKTTVRKVDKVFDALKTTGTTLTGRFNADIIILKVYK